MMRVLSISSSASSGRNSRRESISGRDDFVHQIREPAPASSDRQAICPSVRHSCTRPAKLAAPHGFESGATCHAQSIERNVPHQLFPMRSFEIVAHAARHAGVAKGARDIMCARFRPAAKFAQFNFPMRDVLNHSRRNPVQANKAEATENLFDRKERGERFFVSQGHFAESGLRCLAPTSGGTRSRKLIVGGRLDRDQHEVA